MAMSQSKISWRLSVAGVIGYGWMTAAAAAMCLIGLTAVARIFRAHPGVKPSPALTPAV